MSYARMTVVVPDSYIKLRHAPNFADWPSATPRNSFGGLTLRLRNLFDEIRLRLMSFWSTLWPTAKLKRDFAPAISNE